VAEPDFSGPEEAVSWLRTHASRAADAADAEAHIRREVENELVERPDGRWAWRHHVGALREGGPEAFDDPRLWDQLTHFTTRRSSCEPSTGQSMTHSPNGSKPPAANCARYRTRPQLVSAQPEKLATVLRSVLT